MVTENSQSKADREKNPIALEEVKNVVIGLYVVQKELEIPENKLAKKFERVIELIRLGGDLGTIYLVIRQIAELMIKHMSQK